MKKVSMWTATKKTLLLLQARRRYFSIYFAGCLLTNILYYAMEMMEGLGVTYDEVTGFAVSYPILLMGCSFLLVAHVVGISLTHFSVLSMRNHTSFSPKKPIKAFLQYIALEVLLFGSAAIMIVLITAIVSVIAVLGSASEAQITLVALSSSVICAIGVFFVIVRLSLMFPAIAAGDEWGIKKSWRMTKGHTFRLVFWFSLVFLPVFAITSIWGASLGLVNPDTGFHPTVSFLIISTVLNASSSLFIQASSGVIYEGLKTRYEAMIGGNDFVLNGVSTLAP